jgi:hypothetical protein
MSVMLHWESLNPTADFLPPRGGDKGGMALGGQFVYISATHLFQVKLSLEMFRLSSQVLLPHFFP